MKILILLLICFLSFSCCKKENTAYYKCSHVVSYTNGDYMEDNYVVGSITKEGECITYYYYCYANNGRVCIDSTSPICKKTLCGTYSIE